MNCWHIFRISSLIEQHSNVLIFFNIFTIEWANFQTVPITFVSNLKKAIIGKSFVSFKILKIDSKFVISTGCYAMNLFQA